MCGLCVSGSYDKDLNATPHTPDCVECPSDTTCTSDGITLETLTIKHNYYRTSSTSDDIRKCPYEGLCLGSDDSGDIQCKHGHMDTYCMVCESGWYDSGGGDCTRCSDGLNTQDYVVLGVVVGLILAFLIFVKCFPDQRKACFAFMKDLASPVFKIIFVTTQIIVSMPDVFAIDFPGSQTIP